jgi:predicted CXXCH cytochrome family protein
MCIACHEKVEERFRTSRSRHSEKAAEGRCTACHTSHGSTEPKLVSGEPLKVCASCHSSHAALSHPMGGGVLDPRTQKTLTCLSCHDVHGTANPTLLTFAKERALCIQCHKVLR